MRTLAKPIQSTNKYYDLRDQSALNETIIESESKSEEMDLDEKFFLEDKNLGDCKKLFKSSFIGKFASYIRNRPIEPTQITPSAQNRIITFYSEIRAGYQEDKSLPITARTLETVIISTANAKLCLDNEKITEDDVVVAEMIIRYTMNHNYWDPIKEEVQSEQTIFE